jgi:uncharacterized protein
LIQRDVPFGESHRDGKRSLYRVADPFLRSWYRFVEPNRSRLEAGDLTAVERDIDATVAFARRRGVGRPGALHAASVASPTAAAGRWGSVSGAKTGSGKQLEIDLIAESVDDPDWVLVGEVKRRLRANAWLRAVEAAR